jgi:murein DD-endopeptidase MepM/ murein hydrolase activator NlpD
LAGTGLLCESSDGPHLHFEVRRDDKPVDPLLAFLGLDGKGT